MTPVVDPRVSIFFALTKADEATRHVWGRATQEVPDSSHEVMDYESSLPQFQNWSSETFKRSGGKSRGNLRAMHQPIAAGKVVALHPNDTEKAIDIEVEVTDPNEWQKVEDGVYTGFSVGGKYGKRWADMTNPGCIRYTAIPMEISLVDAPAVPTATYAMVKSDGATELRRFKGAEAPTWVGEFTAVMTKFSRAVDTLAVLKKLEAEENERILGELKQRGSSIGISRRESEPLTPPTGYPTDWKLYGDPANWKWSCDSASRCQSALSSYNAGLDKGTYSSAEWNILGRRIARLVSGSLGVPYKFDPREKRVERQESNKMSQPTVQKADVTALMGDVRAQLNQAVEQVGTDPEGTRALLTQVLAALDVAADSQPATAQAEDPHPPDTQAIDVIKGEVTMTPPQAANAPAPATVSAGTMTAGTMTTPSTPTVATAATPGTPATITAAASSPSSSSFQGGTPTPTDGTPTSAGTPTPTLESVYAAVQAEMNALKEQLATISAALGIGAQQAPVVKHEEPPVQPAVVTTAPVVKTAPLGDLNALVPQDPGEHKALTILRAGGPDAYRKAVEAAGSETELQKMTTDAVVASMKASGIVTADRFKVLNLGPQS